MAVSYSTRDWTEDFPHDNGNYLCRCHDCGESFFGHKRRITCKLCAEIAQPVTTPDSERER